MMNAHPDVTTVLDTWTRFREGTIPCAACGVSVRADVDNSDLLRVVKSGPTRSGQAPATLDLPIGFCSTCSSIHRTAADLLRAFPPVRGEIGAFEIAQHRLASALFALDAIGVRDAEMIDRLTQGQRDLRRLIAALATMGGIARWTTLARAAAFEKVASTTASPSRWAHLSEDLRQELRSAVAGLLARRVERPAAILCPSEDGSPSGCMLCGVGAVEALREDARSVWTLMSADSATIGGRMQPDSLDGVVCRRCDRAIDAAHGVGQQAMTLSVRDFLGVPSHLRSLEHIDGLIGWAALPAGTPPNEKPWDHIDLSVIRDSMNVILGYRPAVLA